MWEPDRLIPQKSSRQASRPSHQRTPHHSSRARLSCQLPCHARAPAAFSASGFRVAPTSTDPAGTAGRLVQVCRSRPSSWARHRGQRQDATERLEIKEFDPTLRGHPGIITPGDGLSSPPARRWGPPLKQAPRAAKGISAAKPGKAGHFRATWPAEPSTDPILSIWPASRACAERGLVAQIRPLGGRYPRPQHLLP